jgi:hypothetical protein
MRSSIAAWLLHSLLLAALLPAIAGCDARSVNGITQVKTLLPKIESFSPKGGPAGTQVTIIGTDFLTGKDQPTVQFAGIAASVVSADSNRIVATVPTGVFSGAAALTVRTAGGTAVAADSFQVKLSPFASTRATVELNAIPALIRYHRNQDFGSGGPSLPAFDTTWESTGTLTKSWNVESLGGPASISGRRGDTLTLTFTRKTSTGSVDSASALFTAVIDSAAHRFRSVTCNYWHGESGNMSVGKSTSMESYYISFTDVPYVETADGRFVADLRGVDLQGHAFVPLYDSVYVTDVFGSHRFDGATLVRLLDPTSDALLRVTLQR